jgi:hypothetical protein
MRARGEKWLAVVMVAWAGLAAGPPVQAGSLEAVSGEACYQYGDRESALEGKTMALGLAKQRAIESHHVFVESSTTVANYQLADDIVKSLSRAMLRNLKIIKEEEQGRKVCVALTAQLDPAEVTALIAQRVNAKQVAQAAQTPLLANPSAFRLKVWTNKEPAAFREGERLVVYVWSERDAYLKLDYYQANGEVVHLVPNLFAQQALIKAGQTYTFGGPDSPYEFMVKAPFGAEAIKALAGTRPFGQELAESEATADARRYLNGLQDRVRGIELRPKQPAGAAGGAAAGGELAEAVVTLTTTERE